MPCAPFSKSSLPLCAYPRSAALPRPIGGKLLTCGVPSFRPAPANSPRTRQCASTAPPLCTAPDRRQGAPAVPLLCTALDRRQTSHPRRAALPSRCFAPPLTGGELFALGVLSFRLAAAKARPPRHRLPPSRIDSKARPPSRRLAPLLTGGKLLVCGVPSFRPAPANSPRTRQCASTAPPLCTAPDRRQGAPAVPLLCTALDRRQTSHLRRAALPPRSRKGASNVLPPCAAHDRHQILQFSPGCVMMIQ